MTEDKIKKLTMQIKDKLSAHIKIGNIFVVRVVDRIDEGTRAECITDAYAIDWYIRINRSVLSDSDVEIKRLIIHELMHCSKSRLNHGGTFRRAYYKACKIMEISSGSLAHYIRNR